MFFEYLKGSHNLVRYFELLQHHTTCYYLVTITLFALPSIPSAIIGFGESLIQTNKK